jgi:MarR family
VATAPTEALDQILELVVLLNEDATQSLARDGLTLPRAGVVWFVHHNGPSTQRAIADFLKVTPRNVTGLVDALVETGFVTREPHPSGGPHADGQEPPGARRPAVRRHVRAGVPGVREGPRPHAGSGPRGHLVRRAYRLVRWLVVTEIGVWRSLFLWVTRRIPGMGPRVEAFSYSRQIAPIMGAFIFVSLIELPVVHLLIPWDAIRVAALVVSVWGLLWMVGMLASMKVFPHLLDGDGLRIRYGASTDVHVPRALVRSMAAPA